MEIMGRKMDSNDYPGTFICLEGIDGSGTTTQAQRLADRLHQEGYDYFVTAEPSTGPIGKLIRKFLGGSLPKPSDAYLSSLMTLLFSADRLEHLDSEVIPALQKGEVVICDRYLLSTFAYQTTDLDGFDWIESVSTRTLMPDVTVVFLLDPEIGIQRCEARGGRKEFYEKVETQKRVDANYRLLLSLGHKFNNVVSVDASLGIEELTEALVDVIRPHIKTCASF